MLDTLLLLRSKVKNFNINTYRCNVCENEVEEDYLCELCGEYVCEDCAQPHTYMNPCDELVCQLCYESARGDYDDAEYIDAMDNFICEDCMETDIEDGNSEPDDFEEID